MVTIDYKISKKSKDIIQKYVSSTFKNVSLEMYGIKTAKVKELINVELPIIEVKDNSMDFVFLLEDDTYLHLEFQTVYTKSDLIRFCIYDLKLFERDERKINTVIIYSSNSKKIQDTLDIGVNVYTPQIIKMKDYDGDKTYNEIENKVNNNIELDELDIVNLLFIPLMKSKESKNKLALKSIKLARSIKDKSKQNMCIGSIFAFAYRYLEETEISEILEVLRMTDLGSMLIEEGIEQGIEKEKIEIVKKALQKGLDIETIRELTDLSIETIKELEKEFNK